jgi:hypothetical protein
MTAVGFNQHGWIQVVSVHDSPGVLFFPAAHMPRDEQLALPINRREAHHLSLGGL